MNSLWPWAFKFCKQNGPQEVIEVCFQRKVKKFVLYIVSFWHLVHMRRNSDRSYHIFTRGTCTLN